MGRRYLSFLKIGPKLLKFLPGNKARDLRNWLQIYGYWNEGGLENVTTMLLYLVDQYLRPAGVGTPAVQVTPPTGAPSPAQLSHRRPVLGKVLWFIWFISSSSFSH